MTLSRIFQGALLVLCLLAAPPAWSQSRAMEQVKDLMAAQEAAWNKGDLEGFMAPYWHSDSLRFIGSKGIVYGWQKTLDNYKKGYPSREDMGTLSFQLLHLDLWDKRTMSVTGKWHLVRSKGDAQGYFSLIWRKINGQWVIVADHSS